MQSASAYHLGFGFCVLPAKVNNESAEQRTLKMKRYELNSHLGTVHAVVSDRKLSVPETNNVTQTAFYLPDVVSWSDGYAFGMTKPGRSGQEDELHRHGYQGSERTPELKENHYTTEFRELDTRIGRWWALDPVVHHHFSPYITMDNSPIMIYDPTGTDGKGNKKTGQISATVYFQFDDSDPRIANLTPGERQAYVNSFAAQVASDWNSYNINGVQVNTSNVQFLIAPQGMTEKDLGKYENLLTVGFGTSLTDPRERGLATNGLSFVRMDGRKNNTGYMVYNTNPSYASHEFGHMLGLADRYFESYVISNVSDRIGNRHWESQWTPGNRVPLYVTSDTENNPAINLMAGQPGGTLTQKQLNIAFNSGRTETHYTKGMLIEWDPTRLSNANSLEIVSRKQLAIRDVNNRRFGQNNPELIKFGRKGPPFYSNDPGKFKNANNRGTNTRNAFSTAP